MTATSYSRLAGAIFAGCHPTIGTRFGRFADYNRQYIDTVVGELGCLRGCRWAGVVWVSVQSLNGCY